LFTRQIQASHDKQSWLAFLHGCCSWFSWSGQVVFPGWKQLIFMADLVTTLADNHNGSHSKNDSDQFQAGWDRLTIDLQMEDSWFLSHGQERSS